MPAMTTNKTWLRMNKSDVIAFQGLNGNSISCNDSCLTSLCNLQISNILATAGPPKMLSSPTMTFGNTQMFLMSKF